MPHAWVAILAPPEQTSFSLNEFLGIPEEINDENNCDSEDAGTQGPTAEPSGHADRSGPEATRDVAGAMNAISRTCSRST